MIPEKAIENMIIEISNQEGLTIYNILKDKEDVNEFVIAEKLNLTINQIRNIMYKFEQYNLITSNRKKDRKKGWYIYFYTINGRQIEQTIIQLKKEKIQILQRQLDRESSHDFYYCPNKCIRLPIENAMEINFTCTECGSLLNPEEKEKNLIKIKKLIAIVSEELNILESQAKKYEKPIPETKEKIQIKTKSKVKYKPQRKEHYKKEVKKKKQ